MGLTGQTGGLWMLLTLGALTITTGLPVWALLIGVSSGFTMLGLLTGSLDFNTLSALPLRLVGLLENDLLQALPLYVFIGMLLQRLSVADALFAVLSRWANPALAVLGVGALIAPMNGSVASSAMLLSRLLAPRLEHLNVARATALISIAATIGVVVPPSLVLILLGDAMMRAHTEATNLPGFVNTVLDNPNIINTQAVFNAALLPGLAVLLLWAGVAWWQSHASVTDAARVTETTTKPISETADKTTHQTSIALLSASVILLLLTGVFTGKLFAVEAAATGGLLLIIATLLTRALNRPQWRSVLNDTLQLSGALMALLVGATVFSLIFRLFGTDRWLTAALLSSPFSPLVTAAGVLLLVALCAWVLDAFEMIFVVIPIVAPPLIAMLGDAQQSAVLLLLVLQLSFLIPPMGYAVMIARSQSSTGWLPMRQLLPALLPFVTMQLAVLVLVFTVPQAVHQLDSPATHTERASEADIVRQMQDMSAPRDFERK